MGVEYWVDGFVGDDSRLASSASSGTLTFRNPCRLACTYCGYAPQAVVELDLDQVREAIADLAAKNVTEVTLSGLDPVDHPQFREVVGLLLDRFERLVIHTTGIGLHAAVAKGASIAWSRIRWFVPLLSLDPARHDGIVGSPGHLSIVMDLLRNRHLQMGANVLLIDAVLNRENLREIQAASERMGFAVDYRLFTPRPSPECPMDTWYLPNVSQISRIWSVLRNVACEQALRSFVRQNVVRLNLCTTPRPFQQEYVEAFFENDHLPFHQMYDHSLRCTDSCPHEPACAFGKYCLGVFAPYVRRFGDGEFDPSAIGVDLSVPAGDAVVEQAQRVRESLSGLRRARYQMKMGSSSEALATLAGTPDMMQFREERGNAIKEAAFAAVETARTVSGLLSTWSRVGPMVPAPFVEHLRQSVIARLMSWAERATVAREWSKVTTIARVAADHDVRDPHLESLAGRAKEQRLFEAFVAAREKGQRERARAFLREILAHNPKNDHARRELARL